MITYIIRRLLLIIPTFFGTTFLVFWILNVTPDGPYDQELKKIKQASMQSGEVTGGASDDRPPGEVDEKVIAQLKREYKLDKPIWHRYLIWLGFAPEEIAYKTDHRMNAPYRHTLQKLDINNDQGVPISVQKWLFPILENGEIVIYESKEGVDFDTKGYTNLDKTNFDAIGFIPEIKIKDKAPYLYTSNKIEQDKNSVLLQNYLYLNCGNCEEEGSPTESKIAIGETESGTNQDLKGYTKLPSYRKATWKDSESWSISREINEASNKVDPNCLVSKANKKTCYASLSIDIKDEIIKSDYFKEHWEKSNWTAKKSTDLLNFNYYYADTIRVDKKSGYILEEIVDGCELEDGNLHLTPDGLVLYNTSSEIGKFEFKVTDSKVSKAFGGTSTDNDFTISIENSNVSASSSGAPIPAGCGTLIELDLNDKPKDLADIKISNHLIEMSLHKHQGIFTGYLGKSNQNEDVSQLIWERLHISSFFGITGFVLSYLVCIPLGIMKALRHGSKFDMASSGLVFIAYSIPAYAFGVLMIWVFATSNFFAEPILPSRGWRPEDWDTLSLWGKIIGQLKYAFLPTVCYMLGSFATLTVLMKNSLMENMSQDYVRTAFAKGLKEKTVIFKHAVRNSLIPLATGIGGLIGLFLAGSYLIEKVFGIDGIGMLGFKSIQNRDFGIFLGFLVIGTVIRLLGNLLSDICYAVIDPRIRFK